MAPRKPTVLILDRDEATCDLYRRELGQRFTVLTAVEERDAWRLLTTEEVDGVILEPAVLEDEAWSFIARLHALGRYRHTPIILCSTLDARRRGAELGIAAYLIKPVVPQLLSRTVQAALHPNEDDAGGR
ncbi:MAG TPA: response regulator [Chloroflexi bacterium]|nr:response regulator [Chloroflexota bacterium]